MHAEEIVLLSAFLLAVSKILHICLPKLRSILNARKATLIENRVTLQHTMKEARKLYEEANIEYFKSFEQKVNWIHTAQEVTDEKIEELKEEYAMLMQELEEQYLQKEKALDQQTLELQLNEVFAELRSLMASEKNINLEKIVRKH